MAPRPLRSISRRNVRHTKPATNTSCVLPSRSPASSKVWSWWNPAWSPPRSGGPSPACPVSQLSWLYIAASRASPDRSSYAGRCVCRLLAWAWPVRRAFASSSTSAPACPPRTTRPRSPSGSPRSPASSTSTTTPWCWCTPALCSPAAPKASPTTSTPTCTSPRRSCRAAARTLDFTQPVALMMLGILGNVADYDEARSIVNRLVDAVPSGSYLVVNDGTNTSEEIVEGARVSGEGGHPYTLRSPEEIAGFFDGLDLQEPGVVSTPRWRPEPSPSGLPAQLDGFCGVARKP